MGGQRVCPRPGGGSIKSEEVAAQDRSMSFPWKQLAFWGPRIQTVPIRREVRSHLSRVCVVIQSLEQSLDGRRPKKSVNTEVVVANVLWNIPEVSCSHVGVSLSLASAEAASGDGRRDRRRG